MLQRTKVTTRRMAVVPLFAVVLLVLAASGDGVPLAEAQTSSEINSRLQALNDMHALSMVVWGTSYDALRADGENSWMDWSEDGCSGPGASRLWNYIFIEGCQRHDMTWRTLPVIDGGTGAGSGTRGTAGSRTARSGRTTWMPAGACSVRARLAAGAATPRPWEFTF